VVNILDKASSQGQWIIDVSEKRGLDCTLILALTQMPLTGIEGRFGWQSVDLPWDYMERLSFAVYPCPDSVKIFIDAGTLATGSRVNVCKRLAVLLQSQVLERNGPIARATGYGKVSIEIANIPVGRYLLCVTSSSLGMEPIKCVPRVWLEKEHF